MFYVIFITEHLTGHVASENDQLTNGVNQKNTETSSGSPLGGNLGAHTPYLHETAWLQVQYARQHLINQTCQGRMTGNMTQDELLEMRFPRQNIVVDRRHQVVYCSVAKAGCSSWRLALATLTGNVNGSDEEMLKVHDANFLSAIGLRPFDQYPYHVRKDILNSYHKLIVVRHPFERIVSAFRDKFELNNKWTKHFHRKYGQVIISKYRNKTSNISSLMGDDVTFPEFITWLTDDSVNRTFKFNEHWETYQELCYPCQIKYDNIVNFDTFDEDTHHILRRNFQVNDTLIFFPHSNVNSNSSRYKTYFESIPNRNILKLQQIYKDDFDMYNYTWTVGV